MAHPDCELKVGAIREAEGLRWMLYHNQFGRYWKAGPRAHNIRVNESDSKGSFGLEDRIVKYATFETAARKAMELRDKEYAAAQKLVADYEAALLAPETV